MVMRSLFVVWFSSLFKKKNPEKIIIKRKMAENMNNVQQTRSTVTFSDISLERKERDGEEQRRVRTAVSVTRV